MPEDQNKPKGRRTAADLAALKAEIIQKLDVVVFYEGYIKHKLPKVKADGWTEHVLCPIHNDTGKPNLSLNIHTGGFKCFACGKAGSIFDFWCLLNGREPKAAFQDALIALAGLAGINIGDERPRPGVLSNTMTPTPKNYAPQIRRAEAVDQRTPAMDRELVKQYQLALKPEHYKYLRFQRGLTDDTIEEFHIGWNHKQKYRNKQGDTIQGKFTIPIFNKEGELRNIRVYSADAPSGAKMINTKGFGSPPRIFPLQWLINKKPKKIIITEGEFDCMLLNQELKKQKLLGGWLAITNTAGCNTWEPDWTELLFGAEAIFLFDADSPGKMWANTIATERLLPAVSSGKIKSVKIVHLPVQGTKEDKDITDFFIKDNGTWESLLTVIEETPVLEQGGVNNQELVAPCIEVDNLIACIKDRQFIDQRVRVPLTISGRTTRLYHATRVIKVIDCPAMKEETCCATDLITIPYGDESFIESCMANRRHINECLSRVACIKNKPCKIEEVEKVVCEEYFAHQQIKRMTVHEDKDGRMVNSQELIEVPVYVLQPEKNQDITPQDYIATGYVRSHPNTRQACLFVEHLEPIAEDWKNFEVNEKSIGHLRLIQSFERVTQILDELANGVTHIHQAREIMLTVLLTYLSPRYFTFNGAILRGWINACIIGDTGTGKTKTYSKFAEWVEVGDIFSMLSGTRTGLLYAIKQKGVEWYVQVGRYVMSSGKIIGVDETQEADPEEIKKMGKAMDEGWLDVSQVASGGYKTETRALFLMNPKFNKKISDFPYGCQALIDCFHPMFIRRLDVAVFSTGKEDPRFYNQHNGVATDVPMKLKPEAMRSLIYWAWTRSHDEVFWSKETTTRCLDLAVEMSGVYGNADDVPLVNPQDFRNNLARLATAYAILSGSFVNNYTGVKVEPEHVEKIAKFLDVVYSSTACNLKQHAKNSGRRKVLQKLGDIDEFDIIEKAITQQVRNGRSSPDARIRECDHFLQIIWLLQQQQSIRLQDLAQQLGCGVRWVQRNMAVLLSHDLVEFKNSAYKITRKFNLFMHRWQMIEGVEQMIDVARLKIGQSTYEEHGVEDYASDTFFDR